MDDWKQEPLIRNPADSYGGSFQPHLLEQYKLYVESADNASARRISSNRYLLTINAALTAVYGLQSSAVEHILLAAPVAVAGILLSLLSYNIIKSFRDLNTAKFKVIHELEEHLPAALYAYEWQLLEKGRGKAYWPTTHIERWAPLLFLALHGVALTFIIYAAICGLPSWAS